jgi:hypothetical protein
MINTSYSRLYLFFFATIFSLTALTVSAETFIDARYTNPVNRYGHFALGRPHEYARLTLTTASGREIYFELPENEVFEDLAPRRIKLAENEPEEILTIVSSRHSGARLVLFNFNSDGITLSAQSPAIGRPMRWLNPVGVADLDGDGRAEIAAVITPHLGGPLKVYRRSGKELIEIAALTDFSNHVYGSAELALSTPIKLNDSPRLLVPNAARTHIRIIALEKNRLVEKGRCALTKPITGPITQYSAQEISVGGRNEKQSINLNSCQQK